MGLGDALELPKQEVVEPLAREFSIDRQKANFCCRGAWLRTYNVFHQRGLVSA
jgi:hypothetical protein